jgi:hypothetical protein
MKYPKPTRENIAMHLVEVQMEMIGKTFEDAEANQNWFHDYTMTSEQFLEFRNKAIPLIKKVYKCNKATASKNFDWWNLNWGLRIFPIPTDVVTMRNILTASRNGTRKDPTTDE